MPANCSLPLGVDNNNFASSIKIFPNPIENSFKIEGVIGAFNLTIYNLVGQRIYNEELYKGEVQISLLPGLYFVTIKHLESNKTFTTKLIKI
ncbi:MAG: T9SS type A sorting domain-containing protein [Bacteroidetes bacterium]|nr:T9SS type A sorting domain-containing protein [Bacteroidota bacterium]